MIIILLGLQGAGKGVFSRMLAEELKIPLIPAGDILRNEETKNTKLGKLIRKYVDKGKKVPDKIIYSLIKKKLGDEAILEGFPRTLGQAKLLGRVDKAIYIKISEETGIKRLSSRVTCENCNRVFNTITLKPKVKGFCDSCGGKLIKRIDDTPELIKRRMDWAKRDLEPILKIYKRQGVLEEVNGEGSVDLVYGRIRKLFK